MCDVTGSAIEEVLLATLTSSEHKDAGAAQGDLLAATKTQGACAVHSLGALRRLHRSGHAAPDGGDTSDDAVSDPDARWRIGGAPVAEKPGEAKPRVVNSYTLFEELGRGRSGVVLRARHAVLRRDVAFKFLLREHTDNGAVLQKFEREARILAHLEHPNIVRVYDAGQDADGNFYIVMELLEEGSLLHFVKEQGRLSAPRAAEWMFQIADALRAAHEQGILHRDVKPDNIMVTPSGVKLSDFNLAAVEESALRESPSTFEGVASAPDKPPQVVGTYHFMSPERINLERGDHRSDIFSFGATFYSVVTGHHLFENLGADYLKWRWHLNKETPSPITERVPEFSPALAAIIDRCLARDPNQRYQTYGELLADVDLVRRELTGTGAVATKAPAPPQRRRRAVAAVLLTLIVAIAYVLFANPFAGRQKPPANESTAVKPDPELTHQNPSSEEKPKEPERAEEKRENPGTDSKKEREPEKKAAKPKIQPRPLLDQLADYDPIPSDLVMLRRVLDLAARERSAFSARSYNAFMNAVAEFSAEAPPPTEGERTFRAWHLNAARDLAELAQFAVSSRLKDVKVGSTVSLLLRSGQTVVGDVKEVDAESVLVTAEGGNVRARISDLAPSNFMGNAELWKASLAFQVLSGSATDALDEILAKLPTSADLLLWIPIVVRLAHEEARDSALQRDFGRAQKLFDRLAALQHTGEEPRRISSLFPYLEDFDFVAVRDERDAFKLLFDDRLGDVAAKYPRTLAYLPAAEKILERFCARLLDEKDLLKKLAAVDPAVEKAVDDQRPKPEDIFEKRKTPPKRRLFDFVGGPACLDWTTQPPDGRKEHWDRQGREKPAYIILKNSTNLQRLIYTGSDGTATAGLILVYRLIPADLSAHWRLGLESGTTRLYLQVTHTTVQLYQPGLGDGAVDKQLAEGSFDAPRDTQQWRTLTLVPASAEDGGVLLGFMDANPRPILRVALKDAVIPGKPVLGVFRGELDIKNVIAPFPDEK